MLSRAYLVIGVGAALSLAPACDPPQGDDDTLPSDDDDSTGQPDDDDDTGADDDTTGQPDDDDTEAPPAPCFPEPPTEPDCPSPVERPEDEYYDDIDPGSATLKSDLHSLISDLDSVGYEGLSADAFLNGLLERGIRHVIDVRRNPIARRYGFHRGTLQRLSGRLSLSYSHFPELGIESAHRVDLSAFADYQRLFERYEAETLPHRRDEIGAVAALQQEQASALLCIEADPAWCHRSRLADAVSGVTGLPVHHLRLAA